MFTEALRPLSPLKKDPPLSLYVECAYRLVLSVSLRLLPETSLPCVRSAEWFRGAEDIISRNDRSWAWIGAVRRAADVYPCSGSLVAREWAGERSLGLGLSVLPSLIDRVRLRRVKGFGLDRFDGPELS